MLWNWAINLRDAESPNIHSVLNFEKTHIITRRIVHAFSHYAIFCHSCLNINKQLNCNVLQYTMLCFQSILSVYITISIVQISTFNHTPKKLINRVSFLYDFKDLRQFLRNISWTFLILFVSRWLWDFYCLSEQRLKYMKESWNLFLQIHFLIFFGLFQFRKWHISIQF